MKLRLVVASLAALVLAGCGLFGGHRGDCSKCGPVDITKPQVKVVNGKITVDQETLVFGEALRNVPVTTKHRIPAKASEAHAVRQSGLQPRRTARGNGIAARAQNQRRHFDSLEDWQHSL